MHLPEAMRAPFRRLVGEFIMKVFRYHEKVAKEEALALHIDVNDLAEAMEAEGEPVKPAAKAQVTSLMDDVEDFRKEFDHDFICNLISQYF